MSPEPMIVQHDDRAIYHRRRWGRTERSEPTSASRAVSNIRTDAIGDAVMIASGKASLKQFRWTLSRGNICSRDAVQRLPHQAHNAKVVICAFFTTRNSLKLQGRRKVFSPIRKVRAISQKLYSHSTAAKSP
jgi:hypothetical protein